MIEATPAVLANALMKQADHIRGRICAAETDDALSEAERQLWLAGLVWTVSNYGYKAAELRHLIRARAAELTRSLEAKVEAAQRRPAVRLRLLTVIDNIKLIAQRN